MSAPAVRPGKQSAERRVESDDVTIEPIPGLPERLPPGERILWSGVPDWRAFAYDAFHLRAIGLYAGLLLAWRFAATLYDGGSVADALSRSSALAIVFTVGLGILAVLALMTAKAARYTITNKRVVMRIGVALTLNINLPFNNISSADYRPGPRKTGAVALTLTRRTGLGYIILWPHTRPFKFTNPQPMLRCINDGERVARILGTALAAAHGAEAVPQALHVTPAAEPAATPTSPVAA